MVTSIKHTERCWMPVDQDTPSQKIHSPPSPTDLYPRPGSYQYYRHWSTEKPRKSWICRKCVFKYPPERPCFTNSQLHIFKASQASQAQTSHQPLRTTVFWTVQSKSNWLTSKLHCTSISVKLICKGHSIILSLLVGDEMLDIVCCWEDFQAKNF